VIQVNWRVGSQIGAADEGRYNGRERGGRRDKNGAANDGERKLRVGVNNSQQQSLGGPKKDREDAKDRGPRAKRIKWDKQWTRKRIRAGIRGKTKKQSGWRKNILGRYPKRRKTKEAKMATTSAQQEGKGLTVKN